MRLASAAEMKGKTTRPTNRVPKPGTALRRVYDLFQANKGKPITVTLDYIAGNRRGSGQTVVRQLVNYYGLDIRCFKQGCGRYQVEPQWLLAGEWFGRVYIDYVAERLEVSQ